MITITDFKSHFLNYYLMVHIRKYKREKWLFYSTDISPFCTDKEIHTFFKYSDIIPKEGETKCFQMGWKYSEFAGPIGRIP